MKSTSSSTGRNGIPKLEIGNTCLDPGEIDHVELPGHPEPPLTMAAICPPMSEEPGPRLLKSPVKLSPGADDVKRPGSASVFLPAFVFCLDLEVGSGYILEFSFTPCK